MPKITVYTTRWCPFCHAAKSLLGAKGAAYIEVDVSRPEVRATMIERANGRRTVPQIFVDDVHIGGYDDMAALDRRGRLDPILAPQ